MPEQRIVLGDWRDHADSIANDSVRLILTSPPYDNARTYEGTNDAVDFGELAQFFLRVLVPGGLVAMVLDGAVDDGSQSVTPYRVICEWAALKGWRFLQMLVYGRQGLPGDYRGRFRKDHEPLILFVKDGPRHICNKEAFVQSTPTGKGLSIRFNSRNTDGSKRPISSTNPAARERVHRGSIWWYGPVGNGHNPSCKTGHPATFAEAFAFDAVKAWSNAGDLVLDPFAGSGTVGFACKALGREHIGFERVEKYHAIAMRRLALPAQTELL
jgi:DNA modification methylase